MKQKFNEWLLLNRQLKNISINKYVQAIDTISKIVDVNIYEIQSLDKYLQFKSSITNNKKIAEINRVGNNIYGSALNYYEKYLEFLRNSKLIIKSDMDFNEIQECNKKRVFTKKDWIDILNNESQSDNIILSILFYMAGCKNKTSNEKNISKALNLNGLPNLDIKRFGERIIALKNIEVQFDKETGNKRYWNIPFTTDIEKNKKDNVFTWKLRDELFEALKVKYNLAIEVPNSLDDLIRNYVNHHDPEEYEKELETVKDIRKQFVERFSINKIKNMSLVDYVIGRFSVDESGKNSFCYLIEVQLKKLGGIQGATVDKFGVWYSKGESEYKFVKKYGNDLTEAFNRVKSEIISLITFANNKNYDEIEKSLLPPLFKGKIISTYFPNEYLCMFKESDVDKFLNILNISYDVHIINTIEKKKQLLKEFKNTNTLLKKYSDYYYMEFLYNTYRNELTYEHTVNGEIDYNIEIVNFEYIGAHKIETKERFISRETDYETISRNKKDIGNRGEIAVLKYEKDKLDKAGLFDLSRAVCLSENDAIGYDIESFDEKGNEIHIEVKTNSGKSSKVLDFYLTDNELDKMLNDDKYYIYYLYNIKNNPKMHIINKEKLLNNKSDFLKPVLYKVSIDVVEKQ